MPVVEEPLAAVVERVRRFVRPGRRALLGIAGAPGAGKSTLVDALGAALASVAVAVGMDGFHLANAELDRLGRRARKGAPDTFDPYGYAALLGRLSAAAEPVVYAPRFDRSLEEPIGSCVPVPRDVPLVLTEGNYLLLDAPGWTQARAQLDEVWFLEVDDEVRIERLTRRHEHYGLDPAAARYRAVHGSDGDNARLVAATRARADLVLRLRPG